MIDIATVGLLRDRLVAWIQHLVVSRKYKDIQVYRAGGSTPFTRNTPHLPFSSSPFSTVLN
ncbi:hypothetical protein CKA32_005251 [Geitlerinema sp. FC II]|nr:hypothetical protein CKA32_005251 [Geitlerinema sp. FC II]